METQNLSNILITIILSSIAVFATSYILPGVHLADFSTAIVVAIVLGLINAFIRPILLLLTLPINILTLGLFTFVLLGFLIELVSWIVPGFHVDNFWWAMAFAVVLVIFNAIIRTITL